MAERRKAPHRQRPAAESDEHGRLASDIVGHPAEEGPSDSVQDIIDNARHHECRSGDAEKYDLHLVEPEIARNGAELRGRHQAAGSNHREHQIKRPEQWGLQHLSRRKVTRRLANLWLLWGRDLSGLRRFQQWRQKKDDDPLAKSEP